MFAAKHGGVGWQPDLPDPRDVTPSHERAAELLRELPKLRRRPAQVDMRDREAAAVATDIPSSVHACLDLLGHSERRVFGQRLAPARHFLHYTAQRLGQLQGTPSGSLRTVWKALARFGVPAEVEWPGNGESREPDAFAFSAARHYRTLLYVRLDPRDQSADRTLDVARWFLAGGFGLVLGLPLSTAIATNGEIGFPTTYDVIRGGDAVLAVGYDDERRVRSDRGCLLVRTYWGQDWGEEGHGWLPYRYIRRHLSTDIWMILQPEWLESGEFRRPAVLDETS